MEQAIFRSTASWMSNEGSTAARGGELASMGVVLIGRHSGELYKARLPRDLAILERIGLVSGVEVRGSCSAEAKLDERLYREISERNGVGGSLRVTINLFEKDTGGVFGVLLEATGVRITSYDGDLLAYQAVGDASGILSAAGLNFVLFVESEATMAGHSPNTP